MGKHLILVGGSYAHLLTIANLDGFIAGGGHRVTVIGPSDDQLLFRHGSGDAGRILRA